MSLSRIRKLEKIVHLNTLMNKTKDFFELLNIILTETEKMFNVLGTSIFLEDEKTGMLYFYIATGEKKDALKSIRMQRGEGVCGYVFETGKSFVENNPVNSKFFSDKVDKKSKFVTKNLLAVPLKTDEKIIGVIELVNKIDGEFTESDVEFLTIISSQVSITLQRQREVEERIRAVKLASMGETVAGLAHFIKNIVNGLRGGAFIINKHIDNVEEKKLKTGWNMVKKNIDKISDLTLSMLAYSKDRVPEYEDVDIVKLLDEIIELEKDRAKSQNVRIKTDFSEEVRVIKADKDGLFRSFLNLVSNAIDALTDKENGKIKISTKKERNKWLRIDIKDNGTGIKEEHLKKLFVKFFSTKGSKGTGLGLPVTKKIIDEHKGSIKVLSREGKGTTFIIRLPLEEIK